MLSFTSGGAISAKQMIIPQTAFLRTPQCACVPGLVHAVCRALCTQCAGPCARRRVAGPAGGRQDDGLRGRSGHGGASGGHHGDGHLRQRGPPQRGERATTPLDFATLCFAALSNAGACALREQVATYHYDIKRVGDNAPDGSQASDGLQVHYLELSPAEQQDSAAPAVAAFKVFLIQVRQARSGTPRRRQPRGQGLGNRRGSNVCGPHHGCVACPCASAGALPVLTAASRKCHHKCHRTWRLTSPCLRARRCVRNLRRSCARARCRRCWSSAGCTTQSARSSPTR